MCDNCSLASSMETFAQKETFQFIHKDLFSWLVAFPLFYLGAVAGAALIVVMVANGNMVLSQLVVMIISLFIGFLGYKLLEASITVVYLPDVSIEISKKRFGITYSRRSYPPPGLDQTPGLDQSWSRFELRSFVPYVVVGAGMRTVPLLYRQRDQWHLYGITARGKNILLAKFMEKEKGLLWEKYFNGKLEK